MSQSEIFELLKNRRLSGDENYFSSEQIRKMLIDKKISMYKHRVSSGLTNLGRWGFLEVKVEPKKVCYRLRKQYA